MTLRQKSPKPAVAICSAKNSILPENQALPAFLNPIHGSKKIGRSLRKSTLLITLFSCLFFLLPFSDAEAQTEPGSFSLGIRAGDPTGITGKYFLRDNHALEGIVSFWPYGPALTALYEIHAEAFNVPGLHWYYGAGAHVRYYRAAWYRRNLDWYYPSRIYTGGVGVGLDAILGISYKIAPIPISVSLDFKPTLEIATRNRSYFDLESAVSIRYHF